MGSTQEAFGLRRVVLDLLGAVHVVLPQLW